MSFVYRPTPIVTLGGKTIGTDHVPLSGWDPSGSAWYPFGLPVADDRSKRWFGYGFKGDTTYPARCGTMNGYTPNLVSPRLNAIGRRTISGDPWILRSGTMRGYMANPDWWRKTLGDNGDDGIVFSDVSTPIDTTMIVDGGDLIPPTFSPTTPITLLPQPSDAGLQPTTYDPGSTLTAPTFQPSASTLPSGLGPALTPQANMPNLSTLQPSVQPSLFQQIASLFTPTKTTTPMTAAMPGVYQSTTTLPSWFGQSTLLPGISNVTALIGGVFVLAMFGAMAKK